MFYKTGMSPIISIHKRCSVVKFKLHLFDVE